MNKKFFDSEIKNINDYIRDIPDVSMGSLGFDKKFNLDEAVKCIKRAFDVDEREDRLQKKLKENGINKEKLKENDSPRKVEHLMK